MKIVLNKCYGGFSISRQAGEFMAARGNARALKEIEEADTQGRWYGYGHVEGMDGYGYARDDADLIAAVEELGNKADGRCASLRVVEIPDGVEWEINDYDGVESIHEAHRSWG